MRAINDSADDSGRHGQNQEEVEKTSTIEMNCFRCDNFLATVKRRTEDR